MEYLNDELTEMQLQVTVHGRCAQQRNGRNPATFPGSQVFSMDAGDGAE